MSNLGWPTGLAWDVMFRLQKEYKPGNMISAVELNARLGKLRIKETDHPDLLFDILAEIKLAYRYQLDEARQISVIMAKFSKIYTNILAYTERLVAVSKEVLTLDHLQSVLNKFWRIEYGDGSDCDSESEDGDEKAKIMSALIDIGNYDKRSKECFNCVNNRDTSQESVDRGGGG